MIIEVVGKEIEKIKGDFESYLNGLNMVGEISYSQYSELYDEGTKQIQKAYELGKSELEEENAELKERVENQKSFLERIKAKFELGKIDRKEIEGYLESEQLTKAREIILRLYNAGRDVLMCRAEEKAYDNLSNAINDKSIEQFLIEVEK
jgi:hypothetical protein